MKEKNTQLYRSDMRRISRSWKLYVSIAVGLIILLRPFFEAHEVWEMMSPAYLLSLPFGSSDFSPFAAIFCVLPFADSFCEDFSSSFANHITLRVGAREYARQRCISVALSGSIVMGLMVFVSILLCALAAGVPETAETADFMRNTNWARLNLIIPYHGVLFFAGRLLCAVLFGAVWASVGLAISTLLPNRYVTLVAPFILYQALWYILSGTSFNPVYMLRGDYSPLSFIVVYQLIIIILCFLVSYFGILRRVKV